MLTFSLEGHLDVAALHTLQNKPFESVETIRGYSKMASLQMVHPVHGSAPGR